jgi:hypothetical protein
LFIYNVLIIVSLFTLIYNRFRVPVHDRLGTRQQPYARNQPQTRNYTIVDHALAAAVAHDSQLPPIVNIPASMPTNADPRAIVDLVNTQLFKALKHTPLAVDVHPQQLTLEQIIMDPNYNPRPVPRFAKKDDKHRFPGNYDSASTIHMRKRLDNLYYLYNEALENIKTSEYQLMRRHRFTALFIASTHGGMFTPTDARLGNQILDATRTLKNCYLLHRSDVITASCLRHEVIETERAMTSMGKGKGKSTKGHSSPPDLSSTAYPTPIDPFSLPSAYDRNPISIADYLPRSIATPSTSSSSSLPSTSGTSTPSTSSADRPFTLSVIPNPATPVGPPLATSTRNSTPLSVEARPFTPGNPEYPPMLTPHLPIPGLAPTTSSAPAPALYSDITQISPVPPPHDSYFNPNTPLSGSFGGLELDDAPMQT